MESRRVFVAVGQSLLDKWRGAGKAGDTLTAVMDYRTGITGLLSLTVDETTGIEIGRMTRARVGRMNTGGQGASASRIVVELARGRVKITPRPGPEA